MILLKHSNNLDKLEGLNLRSCQITDKICDALAGGIDLKKELRSIDLGENRLGPEGLKKLGESLKTHVRLHQFFLDNNYLKGLEAAEGICAALKHKQDLRIFNIDNNNLGSEGMVKLAQGLKITTGLLNLY